MRILHLTLKKKWFDMIAAGIKKEEYREHKPYWKQRIVKDGYYHSQTCKEYDIIRFNNGYAKNCPTMDIECKGITVKDTNHMKPEWCDNKTGVSGRVFIISLGEILQIKNYPNEAQQSKKASSKG